MGINETLAAAGLKCTRQRAEVMRALALSDAPLTAEDIYEQCGGMSLSTVYRTVETLCQKGLAHKHTIQDSDRFYYALTTDAHRHWAICLGCHEMKYVDTCPVHSPSIDDFTVTGHKLEIYGYCDKCRPKPVK